MKFFSKVGIVISLALALEGCKEEVPFNSFVVGEVQQGGLVMQGGPIEMPRQTCWSCFYWVNLFPSLPIEENVLVVHYRWNASPGGAVNSEMRIDATQNSVFASTSGICNTYVGGEVYFFDSEFNSSSIQLTQRPTYLVLKVISDSSNYIGWIKLEYAAETISITDYCFYPD